MRELLQSFAGRVVWAFWLVAVLASTAHAAAPPLLEPTAAERATCQSGGDVLRVGQSATGAALNSTPNTDGTISSLAQGSWMNPLRGGHGWTFYQFLRVPSTTTELYLVWYTYDLAGYPIWYSANFTGASDAQTWRGDLIRYSWSTASVQNGGVRNPGAIIGSVNVYYLDANRTRALVSWTMDGQAEQPSQSAVECLKPTGVAVYGNVNILGAGSEGGWDITSRGGNGLQMQYLTSSTGGSWIPHLTTYDAGGTPTWLQDNTLLLSGQTPNGIMTFSYIRGYCPTCTSVATTAQAAGVASVAFPPVGDANGTWRPTIAVTGTTRAAVNWTSATDLQIARITAAGWIQATGTNCVAGASCLATVTWKLIDAYPQATVYAVNPAQPSAAVAIATNQPDGTAGITYTVPANETRYFELRSGPQSNAGVFDRSPTISAAVIIPDQPIVSLASELGAHDATVGETTHSAGVSGGAAVFEVPIAVPPGRAGMQPSLSLSYSSRGGMGVAGLGMNVSGLSSIHRCPRTVEQDGQSLPVKFANTDRLCLDGQRLVLANPEATTGTCAATYGAANACYQTEIDSFTRVQQLGGDLASAATYFKAQLKSGETLYFGDAAQAVAPNARVTPQGVSAPLSWNIARREDALGNNVQYVYEAAPGSAGEWQIKSIHYTGYGNAAGDRRVEFSYLARVGNGIMLDRFSSYLRGGLTKQTRRLDKITTYVGTGAVREYRLGYTRSFFSLRGRTTTVTDCAYEGTVATCRPYTLLTYQDFPPSFIATSINPPGLPAEWAPPPSSPPSPVPSSTPAPQWTTTQDFDGDGAREMLVETRTSASSTPTYSLVSLSGDRTVRGVFQLPASQQMNGLGGAFVSSDFDNDGRAEIVSVIGGYLALSSWVPSAGVGNFGNGNFQTPQSTNIPFSTGDFLKFTGDLNGDGKSDAVVDTGGFDNDDCRRRLQVYYNTSAQGSSTSTFSTPLSVCLFGQTGSTGSKEVLEQVLDLDGDGLPELFIGREATSQYRGQTARVLFGGDAAATGACQFAGNGHSLCSVAYSALFNASQPITTEEYRTGAPYWLDVNGDGLEDFVYPSVPTANDSNSGCAPKTACWAVRFNRGDRTLGARMLTSNNSGLEVGNVAPGSGVFVPRFASLIRVGDTDADGRSELLFPSASQPFAALICSGRGPDANVTPDDCKPPNSQAVCEFSYVCPDNPRTGNQVIVGDRGSVPTFRRTADYAIGTLTTAVEAPALPAGTGNDAANRSVYNMASIRFYETADANRPLDAVERDNLGVLAPARGTYMMEDVYGDGLVDGIFQWSCSSASVNDCAVPYKDRNGALYPSNVAPQSLAGLPILKRQTIVSVNIGAGERNGLPPKTPEVLSSVQLSNGGSGTSMKTYAWDYYPLSSSGDRSAGETPLYKIPAFDSALRYVDDNHFYFTSSMSVVGTFAASDGLGQFRLTDYSYREAMYNRRGRGFQGFRQIIEEDQQSRARTITTFHQKAPLTGRIESATVSSMNRADAVGLLSKSTYVYGCSLTSRQNACVTSPADATRGGKVVFPFLNQSESWTYDARSAADASLPLATTPLSYRITINAPCTSIFACGSTNASGFDAFGNLKTSLTVTSDGSNGAAGFEQYITAHAAYAARGYTNDAALWWLGRLDSDFVVKSISYPTSGERAVPPAAYQTSTTVSQRYLYNANRTLKTVYTQEGMSSQEIVTSQAYPGEAGEPAGNNYGLPTRKTTTVPGDPNGPRVSLTGYSADGYFPSLTTIAFGKPEQQVSSVVTRARDGQPSLMIDANQRRTTLTYDPFGMLVKTQLRGVSDTVYRAPDVTIARRWCTSGSECAGIANARYLVVEVSDGTPTTTTFYDEHDRVRRKQTRLFHETANIGDAYPASAFQLVDIEYDNRGLVSRQSEPRRPSDAAQWTTFNGYDVLGRPASKTVPKALNDGIASLITRYTYTGRRTDIDVRGSDAAASTSCASVPKCLTMARVVDSLGKVSLTVDALGNPTRYWYDGNGNPVALKDVRGSVTTWRHDDLGRRFALSDPNAGNSSFAYNGYGELLQSTDGRNITSTMTYDSLGRQRTRVASVDLDGIPGTETVSDAWVYDPPYAKGALAESSRTVSGVLDSRTTQAYDAASLGRLVSTTRLLRTPTDTYETYFHQKQYDSYYGRAKQEIHPANDGITFTYSKYGHAFKEVDVVTGTVLHQLRTVTARGQPATDSLGGFITSTSTYAASTGQVTRIAHGWSTGGRTLDYQYDVLGNLTQQSNQQTTETFQYDKLQRLKQATRTGAGAGTVNYTYDESGNFLSKSDFSTTAANAYAYSGGCGGGPNAVKTVALAAGGTRTYCYDAAGNMTSDNAGFAARYDADQLPVSMTRGSETALYMYGADGQKVRAKSSENGRQHVYSGAFERVTTSTGGVAQKTYIGAYAVITRSTAVGRRIDYLLGDRLGSVDTTISSTATPADTRGYDAFGKPRQGSWGNATPPRISSTSMEVTNHGFTAHEHVNGLELIHMNGRVYDYNLGRFLSADPIIQSFQNSQSINPYSYLMNRPLAGRDPTGFAGVFESLCGHTSSYFSAGTCASGGVSISTPTASTGEKPKSNGAIGQSARGPLGKGSSPTLIGSNGITAATGIAAPIALPSGGVAPPTLPPVTVRPAPNIGPTIASGIRSTVNALKSAGAFAVGRIAFAIAIVVTPGNGWSDESPIPGKCRGGAVYCDSNPFPASGPVDAPTMNQKTKDVPDVGPPNEWVYGKRRDRLYDGAGRPRVDVDEPHQGADYPHVHEWENGVREHPGREVPDLERPDSGD